MDQNSIFCYPYVTLGAKQSLLLKTAALYFDKLVLLDPIGISWTNNYEAFQPKSNLGFSKD